MTLLFSPAARDDLLDIALYIAEDNPRRAASFVDELEAKCAKLDRSPATGTERPELGEGMRFWPHGNYLIFYRARDTAVRIERILHGARDVRVVDFERPDDGGWAEVAG